MFAFIVKLMHAWYSNNVAYSFIVSCNRQRSCLTYYICGVQVAQCRTVDDIGLLPIGRVTACEQQVEAIHSHLYYKPDYSSQAVKCWCGDFHMYLSLQ